MSDTILLVEDDLFLREGLCELLQREGYQVIATASAKEASSALAIESPSLVVLDIGLPDGNGLNLCKQWRSEGRQMPIVFLTAMDEEVQVVRGLDAGANDYVAKPFRTLELLSRIRAQLRRSAPAQIQQRGLSIDLGRMTVQKDGESVFVTPTEFKILSVLIRNPNQILSRRQLLEMIWDAGEQFIDDNTLSVHVSRLREKVGVERIRTIRGVGYKWEESV